MTESSANSRVERTGANGSERSLAFAMQKVVGSSPIIRFTKTAAYGGFLYTAARAAAAAE